MDQMAASRLALLQIDTVGEASILPIRYQKEPIRSAPSESALLRSHATDVVWRHLPIAATHPRNPRLRCVPAPSYPHFIHRKPIENVFLASIRIHKITSISPHSLHPESHSITRISFDLDDTLICYQKGVPRESSRIPFFLRPWLNEPLRQGSRALIAELKAKGCEAWICTSSLRSPLLVRTWLAFHGITVGGVVTQDTYTAYLRRFPDSKPPSKNPRVFGIKLHIDDSEGVKREGELYGFDVLVVAPEDTQWAETILETVTRRLRR